MNLYPPDAGSRAREPFRGRAVPYHEQPANKHWLAHYQNSLRLDDAMRTESRPRMRADLRRQIEVCARKMSHWDRHPNFDAQQAARDAWAAKSAAGR